MVPPRRHTDLSPLAFVMGVCVGLVLGFVLAAWLLGYPQTEDEAPVIQQRWTQEVRCFS